MKKMSATRLLLLALFSLLGGCVQVSDTIEPSVAFSVQDHYLKRLETPFTPLTPSERVTDWGKEYYIAQAFAKKLDLYRAISTFERAKILIPPEETLRELEVDYFTLLCYYLANKYDEVIDTFERSALRHANKDFKAFHDLLVIMHEAYRKCDDDQSADAILAMTEELYPETGNKLSICRNIAEGKIQYLKRYDDQNLTKVVDHFEGQKKSVKTAQALNAILPGAGYLYLGQKQSALTAFLLNGLFIGASYEFFHRGYTAAGAIAASFEAGWYFGGIYGAGEAAKYYNEVQFEQQASPYMQRERVYPVLRIQYGF